MLAVQPLVQADRFGHLRNFHGRDAIDEPEHDEREREGPHRGDRHRGDLHKEEMGAAPQQSVHAARRPRVPERRGEHAEHDDPEESAHAVHAPHVQGIVPVEVVLQGDGVIADKPGDQSDQARRRRGDVPRGGRNRRQAGDGSGQQADEVRLSREEPVHDQPRDRGKRRGQIGVEKGHGGHGVHPELAARVEPVPAEPQEPRPERH